MSDFNSSLPVRTETAGDVIAKLCDATVTSQQLAIDSNGRIGTKLFDGAGTAITSQASGAQQALDVGINVGGVQIDPRQIRALTAADVVTAQQGTSPWVISGTIGNFPSTVDTNYGTVGASTIRTASQIGNATGSADFGAGATGVQTLRVEANQGASASAANGWYVKPTDGANSQSYTATGEAKVEVTQPLPAGTNLIGSVNSRTQDGAGTAITSGAQGAKQALDVELNVNGALVNNANPLPVFVSGTVPGTEVLDFKQVTALAGAASDTHTYTVTALKTLSLQQVAASASGKIKVEIKINAVTKAVLFNSTANPNVVYTFYAPQQVAAGVAVAVVITNLDNQPMNVYSTIEGVEN
jgi:hypothetical protein